MLLFIVKYISKSEREREKPLSFLGLVSRFSVILWPLASFSYL